MHRGQIVDVPVRHIMKHAEVVAFSVPQIQGKIAAVIQLVPQEQVKCRTVEQVVDVPMPRVMKWKRLLKLWCRSRSRLLRGPSPGAKRGSCQRRKTSVFLCVVVFCSREDMERICWCCCHQQFFFGLLESSPPVVSPSLRLLDGWCLKV